MLCHLDEKACTNLALASLAFLATIIVAPPCYAAYRRQCGRTGDDLEAGSHREYGV